MDTLRALLRDTIDGAVQGCRDGVRGLRLVRQHPSLLLWGLLPALLQTLWLMSSFWCSFVWLPEQMDALWASPVSTLDALYASVHNLISVVVFLLLLMVGLVVSQVLLAPILHIMGRSIQQRIPGHQGQPLSVHTALSAWKRSVASIALWFLGQLALLPLQIVPIFGGVAEATAGFAGSSIVMTREFMDVALAARGFTLKQQYLLLWHHRFRVITLGGLGTVALWMPLVNILAFPTMSAAAVLLADELREPEAATEDGSNTNDAKMVALE